MSNETQVESHAKEFDRLREAIAVALTEWWRGQEMFVSQGFWSGAPPDPIDSWDVPAHIVALQEAIYREGGE